MRKVALIIFDAMMIASTTLRAQEVKPIEASIEDYIALLNQKDIRHIHLIYLQ